MNINIFLTFCQERKYPTVIGTEQRRPVFLSPAATRQTHSAIFRRSADFRSAIFSCASLREQYFHVQGEYKSKKRSPKALRAGHVPKITFSLFMRTNN